MIYGNVICGSLLILGHLFLHIKLIRLFDLLHPCLTYLIVRNIQLDSCQVIYVYSIHNTLFQKAAL